MIELKKLSNGISVVLESMPYLRTAAFGVWIKVGSVNESKEQNGMAHVIEHLLFQGTKQHSAKELAEKIAEIGDDLNAFTSKEYTSFYGTTITENLPIMIELLSDMLFHSVFDEKEIRKEKKVILDEIDMYEDSPEDLVHELLQKEIWKNHSLGFIISGTKERVRSFKREDIISFWKKFYIPERIVISIAGNFEITKIIKLLEQYFGINNTFKEEGKKKAEKIAEKIRIEQKEKLHIEPYSKQFEDRKEKPPIYHRCFCTRNKEIEQIHFNLAFPSISSAQEERYLFSIANSIFGGSNHSRLFQKIREELGLAYSAYSYGSVYELAGLWHIDITVNPAQTELVFLTTKQLVKEFVKNGITEEELRTHKAQIKTELIMGNESAKARMSSNAKSLFLKNKIITLDENLDKIEKIKKEEIKEFIEQYLNWDICSLCLVGSKKETNFNHLKKCWEQLI